LVGTGEQRRCVASAVRVLDDSGLVADDAEQAPALGGDLDAAGESHGEAVAGGLEGAEPDLAVVPGGEGAAYPRAPRREGSWWPRGSSRPSRGLRRRGRWNRACPGGVRG